MTQPAATPYKQLRRPTTDRMIAGVAGGLGRYFNVDPTLVRVVFAVVVFATWGTAALAYPVMWFLMPEEPAHSPAWPAHDQAAHDQAAHDQAAYHPAAPPTVG